jgi:hypothetical protein
VGEHSLRSGLSGGLKVSFGRGLEGLKPASKNAVRATHFVVREAA